MVASAVRLLPFVVLFTARSGYGQTTADSAARALASARAPQSLEHMHHTAWSKGDGVVSGASDRIQRSADGYLWLGARDGLLRFDGVRFTLVDSATAPALRSTIAGGFTPLLVDHNHDLLVSRPDGAVVRYRDERFQVVIGPGRRGSHFYDIEDRAGRVLVPMGGKLTLLSGGRLVPVVLPPGMPDSLKTIIRDTGTGIWAGTPGAVWHVNGARGERFKVPGNASSGLYVDPLFQARDGTLWVDASELFTLKNNTWSAVRLNGRPIFARRVVEGPNHELLIATRGTGLLRVVDGRIEQMSQRDGLSSSTLMDVLVDAEGTIWMTTEAGLDRLRTTPFTTLSARDHAPFESSLSMVGDASEGIWVQSGDGRLFHGSGGIIDAQLGAVTWKEQRFARSEPHFIIGAGRGGGVWTADRLNGLEFGDARAGRQGPTMSLPDHRTFANIVLEDRSGSAWVVVSPGGLLRVRHGRIEKIPLPARPDGAQPYVNSIAEDADGHIWGAMLTPPRLLELNDGKVIATLDSADNFPMHGGILSAGGRDTLWAITGAARLARLIGQSMRELDIPGAGVFLRAGAPVLELTRKDVWIGGPGGIARLSLAAVNAFADGRGPPPELKTYGREDGLPVARITSTNNRRGAFVARDGRVWFSTPAGPAVYDETMDRRNDVAPHPAIEEVLVDGRVTPHDSAVAIHAGADRVEIRYSAPSLRIPERVRVEYRMERADTGWVIGNALRVAAYPQLRPGRYRFHVRAWNEDGVPSAGEATMNVRVFPQWYESAWFTGAVLLALLSIGPLIVYIALRSRAAARELRTRERFDAALAERSRLARELHDTLLQGFTGITLKLHAIRGSLLVAPQAAWDALTRVLDESDVALVDARQMIWDMRLPELEKHDLPDALAHAAHRMLADRSVELRFVVRGAKRRLAPLVESTVFRIGREAIANTAKHAEATFVEMDLAYGQQGVTLHIRDDGIGIAADVAERAAATGHLGLVGMRERAAQAGGTLAISGAPRAGTELTLTIPLSTKPESGS